MVFLKIDIFFASGARLERLVILVFLGRLVRLDQEEREDKG